MRVKTAFKHRINLLQEVLLFAGELVFVKSKIAPSGMSFHIGSGNGGNGGFYALPYVIAMNEPYKPGDLVYNRDMNFVDSGVGRYMGEKDGISFFIDPSGEEMTVDTAEITPGSPMHRWNFYKVVVEPQNFTTSHFKSLTLEEIKENQIVLIEVVKSGEDYVISYDVKNTIKLYSVKPV